VRPSVVEISTSEGLGSGIVFDARGYIVTNAHVIGSAKSFTVAFSNGHRAKGTLVGLYVPDDLGVIRVPPASDLRAAHFGVSRNLRVGNIVLAIGSPLGLNSSVTQGIVSFNGRTVAEGNGVVLPRTVQTSAAINPGNSGGALVDLDAKVVGIPTLAATNGESGGAANGIGFAIPSDTVKLIAPQLISSGRVTSAGRAAIGISGSTATDASGNPIGVAVGAVPSGGPAAKAGIRPGDLITSVNGQATLTIDDLASVLATLKPGDRVKVRVTPANGSPRTIDVTLADLAKQ
jgi:S1-C subfamily serine protease